MVDGNSGLGQGTEPGEVVEFTPGSDHPSRGTDVASRRAEILAKRRSNIAPDAGRVATTGLPAGLQAAADAFEARQRVRDTAVEAGLPGRGGLQLVGGTEVEGALQPGQDQAPPIVAEPQK